MTNNVEPFYAHVGERIAHIRAENGLTQAALGNALIPPLKRATVANIESAKQRVLVHTLTQIANTLNVDLAELVPRYDEQLYSKRQVPRKGTRSRVRNSRV